MERQGLFKTFKFYQEPDTRWYVDLPEWTGSKADLEMVCGADMMLTRFAEGENKVSLLISETPLDDGCVLELIRSTPEVGGGGNYKFFDANNEYVMDVWLCFVTEWVFSGILPKNIYVCPVTM